MFDSAHVQSLDAIPQFRVALMTFLVEARQALAALQMEAQRATEYITHDCAQFWNGEVRRSWEAVNRAKLEIHNAQTFKRISNYVPSCIEEKKALQKAQLRQRTAETKVELVKHWSRQVQQQLNEFEAKLANFTSLLDGDMPQAVAALERISNALAHYLAVQAPPAAREPVVNSSGQTFGERDSISPPDSGEAAPPPTGMEQPAAEPSDGSASPAAAEPRGTS